MLSQSLPGCWRGSQRRAALYWSGVLSWPLQHHSVTASSLLQPSLPVLFPRSFPGFWSLSLWHVNCPFSSTKEHGIQQMSDKQQIVFTRHTNTCNPNIRKTWCSDTIDIHSSKPQRKLVSWRHKKAAARTGMSTFTLAWSCSIASAKLGFTHGIWAAEAVASPSGLPGFESESGPFGTSPSAVSPGMSSMASGTRMKCPVFADGCVAAKSQPTF